MWSLPVCFNLQAYITADNLGTYRRQKMVRAPRNLLGPKSLLTLQKRCNATRPVCDTCKSVGKKEECIYSANLFSNHQSRHMPRRIRPALSSDQNHSLIPHLREASVDNVRSTKNVLEPDACASAVTSNSTSPKSYYSSLPEFPASEQTAFLSQPEPLLSYGGEPAVLAPEMLAISPRQVLDCGKTTNPLDPFDLSLSYVALEDMNLTL